ncbi:hypothetical protein TNCV_4462471 [Trichonephila clavipes]|nr:hypothetical protein TNCV_4462471 [Trichonephila clavipes]
MATGLVILNYGQLTRLTLELASPLKTSTPTEGRLRIEKLNGHQFLCTAGLQWRYARTHDTPDTSTGLLGYSSYIITSEFHF